MASADWRWCCAPQAVQRLWQTEGVDGPSDLATLYTSAAEVRADLQKRGLADEDVNMGMLAWSDAPRAMASLTTRPRVAVPAAVAASSTTTRTSRKRVRTSSTKRAPGGRVADEQGFGEIDYKIFEECGGWCWMRDRIVICIADTRSQGRRRWPGHCSCDHSAGSEIPSDPA